MGVFMKDRPIRGAVVLCPLVLDVDEGPLSAAEYKMLQAGQLEEVLLLIDHPRCVQVTPAGRLLSSTVT